MNENTINQQYDRITQMLKQATAAPIDYNQMAITNMANPEGYAGAVQGAVNQRQQNEGSILQLFEAQKARGDKQAQALDDKISLFTGGDPEGTALILDQLHADPEQIDPSNSYQVMTKIAGIVKKSGYVSPAQQEQKLAMQIKKQQLSNAQKGPEKPANQKELEYYNSLPPDQQKNYRVLNKIPEDVSFGADANPAAPQASGDSYLQTLDPKIGDQVKALAEGRMQFPSGFALKSPYWQQMLQAVSAYDPNFDAVNYNARATTRKDFTSGKSAQNITALNTAISHLGTLSEHFDELGNTDYPAINKAKNYLGNEFGFDKIQAATSSVGADATAVSHELAKVFRQTGMSQAEIEDWEKKINTSNSPAQNKAVIDSAIDLMNGRLDAIGEQYNQGMGTTSDPMQLLSPHAQDTYQKLRGSAPTITGPEDPKFQALPAGASFVDAETGKTLVKH